LNFDPYIIRHVSIDDLDGYYNLIDKNRKRLEAFFAGLVAITGNLESTKAHLEDVLAKHEKKHFYSFIVIDSTNNRIIGSIQLKSIDWNIPKAEVGYYIDSDYEGKGITSTAVSKVIAYGFDELKMNKLFLRANSENKGSVRVAEKNGFRVEGVLRKDYKSTDGTLVDLVYYGLLRDDVRKPE